MMYLANAFSLQMIDLANETSVEIVPVTKEEVAQSGFESVVGHQDTANVLTTLLGVEVPMNRKSAVDNRGYTVCGPGNWGPASGRSHHSPGRDESDLCQGYHPAVMSGQLNTGR